MTDIRLIVATALRGQEIARERTAGRHDLSECPCVAWSAEGRRTRTHDYDKFGNCVRCRAESDGDGWFRCCRYCADLRTMDVLTPDLERENLVDAADPSRYLADADAVVAKLDEAGVKMFVPLPPEPEGDDPEMAF